MSVTLVLCTRPRFPSLACKKNRILENDVLNSYMLICGGRYHAFYGRLSTFNTPWHTERERVSEREREREREKRWQASGEKLRTPTNIHVRHTLKKQRETLY
jgi:hypothetical protein